MKAIYKNTGVRSDCVIGGHQGFNAQKAEEEIRCRHEYRSFREHLKDLKDLKDLKGWKGWP